MTEVFIRLDEPQNGTVAAMTHEHHRRAGEPPGSRASGGRSGAADASHHVHLLREEAPGAEGQDGEEEQVAGEDAPARVDLRAERLRHPEQDAPDQRAPQRAQPPMITASYAKISRAGPAYGAKVVRMPRKTPAMPTIAQAMAMASP